MNFCIIFFYNKLFKYFNFIFFIEKPPAILCPPPFINNFILKADKIIEPISKPTIDLADAFPILLVIEIIIVGLLNLSLILDAIIPIIPSCQL